jgi:hypothetical protein
MSRWLIVLMMVALFFGIIPAQAVQAQGGVEFDSVQVDLWPEYDRPEVLVIYRLTLSDATSLPAQVSLRIPAVAGDPYNLANQDVDGMLYLLNYEKAVEGEWLRLTFTTPTPNLQIEFYDPGIKKQGNLRSYEFKWAADYSVTNMTVKVQQPLKATDFKLAPAMGSAQKGSDGLLYYTTVVGAVDVATPVSLSFSYLKPDETLSFNSLPVQVSYPVQAPGAEVDWPTILPWILGGAGVLLLGLGGLWFWRSGRKSAATGAEHRHRPNSSQTDGGAGGVFCHQCGKRSGPGDTFCRACGTRLRTE